MNSNALVAKAVLSTATCFIVVIAVSGCPAGPPADEEPVHHAAVHDAGSTADATPARDASGTPPTGLPTSGRALEEVCGNGLDDNSNMLIDEGCACIPDQTQHCSPLTQDLAGVGACVWGTQTCEGDEIGNWASCVGAGLPSAEVCDGIDNNCDGRIDEGCLCTLGDTRSCYGGPPGTEGVGVCRAGSQTCVEDGSNAAWGACTGDVTPSADLCDGMDNECNGMPDAGCLCPPGQMPVYVRPDTGGGSGILPAGSTLLTMVCESTTCPPGEAGVANNPLDPSAVTCVPTPPHCPAGEQLNCVSGMLECVTCDIIIQFGAIYGNQRVCTTPPTITCSHGEVPTFVYETMSWQCEPECDGSTYDPHEYDGVLVCVPC